MRSVYRPGLLAVVVVLAGSFPTYLMTQEAPDTIHMPGSRRAGVTFVHIDHVDRTECVTCHHEPLPENPGATDQGPCSGCHADIAEEPMRTNRRDAFHNVRATAGICVDCHTTSAESGATVPVRCAECHKTEET